MSDEVLENADAPRSWHWPFGWLGLFAVAWAVYELTRSPALGAVFICLKFGWEDFRAASWLSRHDPQRCRRRCLVCLYLAWGLWKTALVAFLMSIAFAAITPRNLPLQAGPQALFAFLGTFLTTLIGFALATLLTALAVTAAWAGGVRLWLDSGVHRARRFDFWPPTPFCEGRPNRLGSLLLTGLGLLALGVLVVVLAAADRARAGTPIAFLLSVIAPVVIVLGRELLAQKVWADSPSECWPEEWDPEQQWREESSLCYSEPRPQGPTHP